MTLQPDPCYCNTCVGVTPRPVADPRWAWCDQCVAYIGASPPLLHPYWPADKSAAMHRAGAGHKVRMVGLPTRRVR